MKVHKYSLWNFKSTKEKKWKEKLRKKEIKKEKVQEYSFTLKFTMETFLLQQSPNTTSYVYIIEWRHYFSTIWFPSISNKWLEARSVSEVYLQTVTQFFFCQKVATYNSNGISIWRGLGYLYTFSETLKHRRKIVLVLQ